MSGYTIPYLESVLQRCNSLPLIHQFHSHLVVSNLFQTFPPLRTKLLETTSLLSSDHLNYAFAIFNTARYPLTNDFNSLLRGIARGPHPSLFLPLYSRLLFHCRPDALSLSFSLQSTASLSNLSLSTQLHCHVIRLGCRPDVILMTTLLDAYAKCGRLDYAEDVFEEMSQRDIATWNALIIGFAHGSRPHDALSLFNRLKERDSTEMPNQVTVVGALSACAQLGALRDGETVWEYVKARRLDSDVRVLNAVIDMYSKCGAVNKAEEVFGLVPRKSLVSWNAVIMALAMHGRAARALYLFDEMLCAGDVAPDAVTYLSILCGCVHAGLVEEGLRIFKSMTVRPTIKHYGCIVDLLGRAGRLTEAYNVVTSMPSDIKPDVVLWQTLLGACKTYGDVPLAELVSTKIHEMGSNGCGDYVLLSNVYAAKQRWSDVDRVRDAMVRNDVRKVPGFSYTEIDGIVHKFLNGDKEHARSEEIYRTLDDIGARIKSLGYVPETSNVLHDINEEDKENALYHHSEKLAIAFGLINTPAGTPIYVIKNLRICGDCHTVAKLISKAYERVIIVRDRARYHHFENGVCSCQDYW